MREHLPQGLAVPGSLLLAGEYAVLEEGGLGYACAVEPRVSCTWAPHDRLCVRARYGNEEILWSPGESPSHPLLDAAWLMLQPHLGSQSSCPFMITVDSTALAHADGRKVGLGSSAAAMVALITALLYLHTKRRPPLARVFPIALSAHRQSQGGRGSGYDVACSTFGGLGLFTGGALPVYQRLQPALPLTLTLARAPHPIDTGWAIQQWRTWKRKHPGAWNRHLEQSQKIVQQLVQTQEAESFSRLLSVAATLGKKLGQRLEVWNPANEPAGLGEADVRFQKALGAGNELYALAGSMPVGQAIEPSAEGVTWN